MSTRRITEEQFESGSAIDGSRIQKALTETEEYFNNIPLEAIEKRYSLNYLVFTSLNANILYENGAPSTPYIDRTGYFRYSPFLPPGSQHNVKGIFREERNGADTINSTTGVKSRSYRVFSTSTLFDRPVIIDSVSLFMTNKEADNTTQTPVSWSSQRYESNQKYEMYDSLQRSIQRTRIIVDTDDVVSAEDRTLNSKEFVIQDFQEKFFYPAQWSAAASASMFPETAESASGKFVENPVSNHSLYLFKENVNIPIHQGARVRFRVISYADGTAVSTNLMKDIKPENMTFVVVYKEALISG